MHGQDEAPRRGARFTQVFTAAELERVYGHARRSRGTIALGRYDTFVDAAHAGHLYAVGHEADDAEEFVIHDGVAWTPVFPHASLSTASSLWSSPLTWLAVVHKLDDVHLLAYLVAAQAARDLDDQEGDVLAAFICQSVHGHRGHKLVDELNRRAGDVLARFAAHDPAGRRSHAWTLSFAAQAAAERGSFEQSLQHLQSAVDMQRRGATR